METASGLPSIPNKPAPPAPPEIEYGIAIGEVKSTNWSARKAVNYADKFIFTEGLDIGKGGIQASIRYADLPTLYIDLFELGGMEQHIKTYQLALDPQIFQKATAGLRFGTEAYGNAMEPVARARLSETTGQAYAPKHASAGGADILPQLLRLLSRILFSSILWRDKRSFC